MEGDASLGIKATRSGSPLLLSHSLHLSPSLFPYSMIAADANESLFSRIKTGLVDSLLVPLTRSRISVKFNSHLSSVAMPILPPTSTGALALPLPSEPSSPAVDNCPPETHCTPSITPLDSTEGTPISDLLVHSSMKNRGVGAARGERRAQSAALKKLFSSEGAAGLSLVRSFLRLTCLCRVQSHHSKRNVIWTLESSCNKLSAHSFPTIPSWARNSRIL
jgi:hypothetical protein